MLGHGAKDARDPSAGARLGNLRGGGQRKGWLVKKSRKYLRLEHTWEGLTSHGAFVPMGWAASPSPRESAPIQRQLGAVRSVPTLVTLSEFGA